MTVTAFFFFLVSQPFEINSFIMFMCKKKDFTEEESGFIECVLHEAEETARSGVSVVFYWKPSALWGLFLQEFQLLNS